MNRYRYKHGKTRNKVMKNVQKYQLNWTVKDITWKKHWSMKHDNLLHDTSTIDCHKLASIQLNYVALE